MALCCCIGWASTAVGQPDRAAPDDPDVRIVVFDHGPEAVHKSIVLGPSPHPFGIPPEILERVERARQDRATSGYIKLETNSLADQALERLEYERGQRAGALPPAIRDISSGVSVAPQVPLGNVRDRYIHADSQRLMFQQTGQVFVRLYDRTSFGTLVVREFIGGKVHGLESATSLPNFTAAGYEGYAVTQEALNGKRLTRTFVQAEGKIVEVEAGSEILGDEDLEKEFRDLFEGLLLERAD